MELKGRLIWFWVIIGLFVVGRLNGQTENNSYMQARVALQQKLYDKTVRQIVDIPASSRTAMMYTTLGEGYYYSDKYSEALQAFVMADSLKTTAISKLWLARTYARLGQQAKAVLCLKDHLQQRDRLPESDIMLDPAFVRTEHTKDWKILWEKEWYNISDKKLAEAQYLFKRKKYTESLEILDQEIAKHPSVDRLYMLRAKIYQEMEQYGQAFDDYTRTVELRNNKSEYRIAMAEVALILKKDAVALEQISQAMRIDPYQPELFLKRAVVNRSLKQYEEAKADLNTYFTYFPSDNKALYQMGKIETENGNLLEGIELFSMLIEKDKSSADYFLARAGACIKAHRYDMADDDVSQALDLNPKLPQAWFDKGIILFYSDKITDACYYWKKSHELGHKEAAGYLYKYCIGIEGR